MNRVKSFRNWGVWIFGVLIGAGLISCQATKKVTVDSKDLSYLYNPTKVSLKPRFAVLNQSDAESVLSVKFFTIDLFFSEANPRGLPMAQLLVSVKLYNTTNERILADTASMNINIIKEQSRQEYAYKIPLRVGPASRYVAEVKILDRLRLEIVQAFIPFNTLTETNKYNFIARGNFNKNELFNPVIKANEFVNLLYQRKPVDSLFISFYKPFTEVPHPPSMLLPEKVIDYDPDTVVVLPYSDTLPIMFPNEGMYFCSVARGIDQGYTFFNFGPSYPTMTKPEEMIKPLAYLATEDEMNTMLSSPKPKMALDEFWIKCGGNVEKSRELIRIFYTRILYSNYYFTSFKEGWRTERGMIYTIYGPPDKVYKSSDGENWGYRRPVIKSSWGGRIHLREQYLWFKFMLREDRFSDNDFFLNRSEALVTYWDKAIASWRKGIVFRLDNPEDL